MADVLQPQLQALSVDDNDNGSDQEFADTRWLRHRLGMVQKFKKLSLIQF